MFFKTDQQVGGLNVRGGDEMLIHIWGLHHDPKQWQTPHIFIPERFDPDKKQALTPEGKKRDPNSYLPFLGGHRICFGKRFAEVVAKTVDCMLVHCLEMEFEDKDRFKTEFPMFNIMVNKDIPVNVHLSRR
jgi:cytochrome P450